MGVSIHYCGRLGDVSGLSAEGIALRIEQWFLENKDQDA